jgi:hypothetical protein
MVDIKESGGKNAQAARKTPRKSPANRVENQ